MSCPLRTHYCQDLREENEKKSSLTPPAPPRGMTTMKTPSPFTWVSKKVTPTTTAACLTCGTPVCRIHRSSDFQKHQICVCDDCAQLFSTDYILRNIIDINSAAASGADQKDNIQRQSYNHSRIWANNVNQQEYRFG